MVLGQGDWLVVRADDEPVADAASMEILLLGGLPIGEPVVQHGPFVMNTRQEIREALDDFESGAFGQVPPNALMPHVFDPEAVRAEHTGI